MRNFITTNKGGHRLKLDDFEFIQQAYKEGFKAMVASLVPYGTTSAILSGCELLIGNQIDPDDTDNDGTPDAIDVDDDQDGVPDEEDMDDDGDGVLDNDEDADGIPDEQDPDDDDDGVSDEEEDSDPDADNDGLGDDEDLDDDNDGEADATDLDDDGDGTADADESDLDGDGLTDDQDTDVDGDGLSDEEDEDDDNDGQDDDAQLDSDEDGDGETDEFDSDDDNDGIADEEEADTDSDGIINDYDSDIDGDGTPDQEEDAGSSGAVAWKLTSGFIYLEGEVFFVPEQEGLMTTGEEAGLKIAVSFPTFNPVEYADGKKHYIHQIRTLELFFADDLTGAEVAYDDLENVTDLLRERLGLSDTNNSLEDHETRIADLEDSSSDHETRIAALETDSQAHDATLDDHEAQIGAVETQASNLETQLNAVAEYTVPIGFIGMTNDDSEFDGNGLGLNGTRWQGWAICNGNYGTPDLRGRFVVGQSDFDPDIQYAGQTGGENEVVLYLENIPAHTHTYDRITDDGAGNLDTSKNDAYQKVAPTETDSGSAGGDVNGFTVAHENRPPFYVLFYVQRIS